MSKKYLALIVALVPVLATATAPATQAAESMVLASPEGSGCTVTKIHGDGRYTKDWDWVEISCGQIIGASFARGKIVCDWAPDRYTSWASSHETMESGGCPFSSGPVSIEYK